MPPKAIPIVSGDMNVSVNATPVINESLDPPSMPVGEMDVPIADTSELIYSLPPQGGGGSGVPSTPNHLVPDPAPVRQTMLEHQGTANITGVVVAGAESSGSGSFNIESNEVDLAEDFHKKVRANPTRKTSDASVTLGDHSITTTCITTELTTEYGTVNRGPPDFVQVMGPKLRDNQHCIQLGANQLIFQSTVIPSAPGGGLDNPVVVGSPVFRFTNAPIPAENINIMSVVPHPAVAVGHTDRADLRGCTMLTSQVRNLSHLHYNLCSKWPRIQHYVL